MPIYDCGDPDCNECRRAFRATTWVPEVAKKEVVLPDLPQPFEIEWPTYHYQGMGCGIEDRCITDRYEAAHYGWEHGVERAAECIPEAIYTADQMREYALAALHRAGLAVVAEEWKPIESAPKDGTFVILGRFMRDTPRDVYVGWHDYSEPTWPWKFIDDHSGKPNAYHRDFSPTHWRPLPPAPASRGVE